MRAFASPSPLLLLLLCFSCALARAEEQGPFELGVLYWSKTIKGQVAMRVGFEREIARVNSSALAAKERTIQLMTRVAGDGPAGIENQIRQMKELLNLRPDLLVVQPTDNAALAKCLVRANELGVPVIAYDQYISGRGRLLSYLTSDNYQAGFLNGEYVASLFPAKRKIKLVLVDYPHVSSTVERVDGFLDGLRAYQQRFEILKIYPAVEPVGGAKAGAQILRDFPAKGSIDALFTVNDGGGLSVVDALAKAGRREIVVATIDGDPRSVRNILAGRLTRIDCAQFCGALGRETARVAVRALRGERVPRQVLIPVFPITKDTHQLFRGWNRPPTKSFRKPWASKSPEWTWKLVEKN